MVDKKGLLEASLPVDARWPATTKSESQLTFQRHVKEGQKGKKPGGTSG